LESIVDSKAAPVVQAVLFPEGTTFRDEVRHKGILWLACRNSVFDETSTATVPVVRCGVSPHGLRHPRRRHRWWTEALRTSAVPRTRPKIRVSNEEGNVDQCPPTGGKSDRHR
jgi:hypothetical protein